MRSLHALLALFSLFGAQPEHGRRPDSLVIRNAMVVEGNGTPASGPKDIVVEGGRITRVAAVNPSAPRPAAAVEIDAAGRYVLPGLINAHGHIHSERGGAALPVDYCLKLWLACGVTTVRDVGGDFNLSKSLRAESKAGARAAPRLFVYPFFGRPETPAAATARVKELHAAGADGIKLIGAHRDIMAATLDQARTLNLRVAHHMGVEETNAWDAIRHRVTSIEHWYGIPDAALAAGVQSFPPSYNYNDEIDRFRYAGRLWREADPKRLAEVLDGMVKAGVAWDPTLNIYEASRDLERAQNRPWSRDFLHPVLARFFEPNPANHGSYFADWTSTDEACWRENYRLWMAALADFARRGGLIGAGEDAGYIYQVYGFGLLRELELHQEAGFHPLKIIQHATLNNALILGQEQRLGRVRAGWAADLIVVKGNPLEDFKILYPHRGGIEWTIKDGIPYRPATLLEDVKTMVRAAR